MVGSCSELSHRQGRAVDTPGSVGSEGWGLHGTGTFLSPQRLVLGPLPWGLTPSLGLILHLGGDAGPGALALLPLCPCWPPQWGPGWEECSGKERFN